MLREVDGANTAKVWTVPGKSENENPGLVEMAVLENCCLSTGNYIERCILYALYIYIKFFPHRCKSLTQDRRFYSALALPQLLLLGQESTWGGPLTWAVSRSS